MRRGLAGDGNGGGAREHPRRQCDEPDQTHPTSAGPASSAPVRRPRPPLARGELVARGCLSKSVRSAVGTRGFEVHEPPKRLPSAAQRLAVRAGVGRQVVVAEERTQLVVRILERQRTELRPDEVPALVERGRRRDQRPFAVRLADHVGVAPVGVEVLAHEGRGRGVVPVDVVAAAGAWIPRAASIVPVEAQRLAQIREHARLQRELTGAPGAEGRDVPVARSRR